MLNGFGVCYEFLAFYDAHGGQKNFGNPISSFEFQQDGRLVQYFEGARFEWHPELGTGQNVMLADLGRIYFNAHEDGSRMKSSQPLNAIPVLLSHPKSIQALSFVEKSVTLPDDTQKIYVIVQDQALGQVPDATGSVTIHLSKGQEVTYLVTTDQSGMAVIPAVAFKGQNPGELVTVDVEISYQGLKASSSTSFRIWR